MLRKNALLANGCRKWIQSQIYLAQSSACLLSLLSKTHTLLKSYMTLLIYSVAYKVHLQTSPFLYSEPPFELHKGRPIFSSQIRNDIQRDGVILLLTSRPKGPP